MKLKINHSVARIGLFMIMSVMLIGLFADLLPSYSAHSTSMIIGTIAYISIVALAWLSNDHSQLTVKFLTLAIASFTAFHFVTELFVVRTMNFLMLTSTLGYAALGLLVAAILVQSMRFITRGPLSAFALNGLMTSSTVLVYWHVSSIEIVRSSLLFFVPFTALCLLTLGQFIYRTLTLKRLVRASY